MLVSLRSPTELVGFGLLLQGLRVLFVCCCCLFAGVAQSAEAPVVLDMAVLQQRDGVVDDIASVAAAGIDHFEPVPHSFSGGYTRQSQWFRFTLNAAPGEWWLSLLPPQLDSLQLFTADPAQPGAYLERHAGDHFAFQDREVNDRSFVFKLHKQHSEPMVFFLRMQTTSATRLLARISTPAAFYPSSSLATGIDYGLVKQLVAVLALVLLSSLYWIRKLNLAKRMAEQTAEQQRQFIAMLSHEVRTPLAVIDASTQVLMLRLKADTDTLPLVNRIHRGAARLSYFFDNCLTADRIDSQKFAVQPLPVDIGQLVTWVAESAAPLSPEHSIELDIEAGLPALQGDQVLLRMLLMNLLSNALKYSPAATPVLLRVWRKNGEAAQCCFTVEDRGPGIPPDELDLIFRKFQRGRAAQGKPGAGLGLSVVSRIAELHGGKVKVASRYGHGAEFTVEIPF